jgi:hypothetical protein
MDLVATASLCRGCLTPGHGAAVRTCPFRRELKGLCAKLKCKQSHHQLLHMEGKPELSSYHRTGRSASEPNKHPVHIVAATAHLADQPPAQLVTQRIRTAAGEPCITFWDTGSQVTLMTHGAAKGLGLKPIPGPPLNLKVWWPDATLFYFISFFFHTIHSHILTSMNIRLRLLSISSSLISSVADTSLGCRVGIRSRARLTASRHATN